MGHILTGESGVAQWVAVTFGALDVREVWSDTADFELMLLPTIPGEPLGLSGAPAELWRRLVTDGVDDASLHPDEQELVRLFAEAGIASDEVDHPARIRELPSPWLSSPLHELVYALVASVAREEGIGAIFVKGPVLHEQGLREREHSGDVDAWIQPSGIIRLARALGPWGWRESEGLWSGIPVHHSITLAAPHGWGCEIDLHRHMPGCAVSDDAAFRVLSTHVEPREFAGVSCLVPQPAAHAVLAALHAMRPVRRRGTTPAKREEATQLLRQQPEHALAFAEGMRAVAVLREPFTEALGREVPCAEEVPRNWEWREHSTRASELWHGLRIVPWRYKGIFVARVVWPTDLEAARSDRDAGGDGRNLVRARARRWGRGVMGLFRNKP